MAKVKNNNSYQMLVSPKEEEIFRQVESDECLGSKALGKDATVLEKIKYELCQSIVRYKRKKQLDLKKISRLLKLDELAANKLLHYYTENFALDSLISYVEKLNIPCQVKITPENVPSNHKTSNGRTRKHA
ncbi:13870_t:CDS:1 [Funneliformis geosporum]|nr:13870_t:CDS:1 [Funneliformis geosporum]